MRYEQHEYLNQQKEFLELQKIDITENKENRKKTQDLTFVLAFGIVIASFFYLFQTIIEFKKAGTSHTLIISAIFIFLLLIFFTISVFKLEKEVKEFLKKSRLLALTIIVIVAFLSAALLLLPDRNLNNGSSNEMICNAANGLSQDSIMPKTNYSTTKGNLDSPLEKNTG